MKRVFIGGLLLTALSLNSCATRLGDFTILANGNVDSKTDYQKLATNVEATYKTKKDDPLEECVDKAVKSVPGGEFLKNVSIYVSWSGKKVRVVGDVYGVPAVNQEPVEEKKTEGTGGGLLRRN